MRLYNQRRQRASLLLTPAFVFSVACSTGTPDRAATLELIASPPVAAISAPPPQTVATAPLPSLQPCATSVPVVATPISEQKQSLRPHPGAVAIGAPTVAGSAIPNAPAVVAGMRVRFTSCYNTGLEQDWTMRGGGLEIVASVGADGCVLATHETCGAGLTDSVRACVAKRVQGACFGGPVHVPTTVTIRLGAQPAPDLDARRPPSF
jgi:hypothetical protein